MEDRIKEYLIIRTCVEINSKVYFQVVCVCMCLLIKNEFSIGSEAGLCSETLMTQWKAGQVGDLYLWVSLW